MHQPDMIEPELQLAGGSGAAPTISPMPATWPAGGRAREHHAPAGFTLTPPPGPRQPAAAPLSAEAGALLTLMETAR